MTLEKSQPAETLAADGWRESPNQFKKYARCFYKRFDTPTRCACNDKPGMQIEVAVSDTGGMEMELCGELRNGTWLKVLNYALPSTVQEVTALIPRLLAVWETANVRHDLPPSELERNETDAMARITEWRELSDAGLRLRCGEMTAQEIRTVRAVLNALSGGRKET